MAYRTDGRSWPALRCELNVTGPAWPQQWQGVALAAMQAWNSSGARFTFTPHPGAADHLAAYDLGRWNGWLAMTYTQPAGSGSALTSGQVLINLHYQWDPGHPAVPHRDPGGPYDLTSVLVHEFGHLLHLGDEVTAKDVMKPTIKPGVIRQHPGQDDVAGIRHLYPMLAEFDVNRLAREAEVIVRGTVVASGYGVVRFRMSPEETLPDLVFSAHRVRIEYPLKSAPPSPEIDVLTLGGRTPTFELHVESEAALHPNEQVVLFLTRDLLDVMQRVRGGGWELAASVHQHPYASQTVSDPFYPPYGPDSYTVLGGFQGKYSIYRRGETPYIWRPGLPPAEPEGLTLGALERQIASVL